MFVYLLSIVDQISRLCKEKARKFDLDWFYCFTYSCNAIHAMTGMSGTVRQLFLHNFLSLFYVIFSFTSTIH